MMILTTKEIDGNEELVGRKLKLIEVSSGAKTFDVGTIVTCIGNYYGCMRVGIFDKGGIIHADYVYSDEKWELV